MGKKISFFLISVLLFSLTTACTKSETKQPTIPSQLKKQFSLPGKFKGEEAKSRPETKKDFIKIEGDDYEFSFKLFDAVSLRFTTYLPIDSSNALAVEQLSSGEGDGVIIKSDCLYNGQKREDVYFVIHMSPPIVKLDEAINVSKNTLTAENSQISQREDEQYKYYKWALHEFDYKTNKNNISYIGTVAFGQKDDRIVKVISHLPEDFVEGFMPIMDKLLEDMEWY